eukprot:2403122-Ditylum_brightwellii.AAC.1
MSSTTASHHKALENTISEYPYEITLQNIPFCQLWGHQWQYVPGTVEVLRSSSLHQSAGNRDYLEIV